MRLFYSKALRESKKRQCFALLRQRHFLALVLRNDQSGYNHQTAQNNERAAMQGDRPVMRDFSFAGTGMRLFVNL